MFRSYEKTYRIQVPQFTVPGKHYLTSDEVKLLLAGQITIEEKLDGCLQYDTRVLTPAGQVPVGLIVNEERPVKVLSRNLETGENEFREVTNWHKNGKGEKWLRIHFDRKSASRSITLTPNHEIYTPSGKIQAGELRVGDMVLIDEPALMPWQFSLLLGSLLGDGSLRTDEHLRKAPLYSETHGDKQKAYQDYKEEILGKLVSKTGEGTGRYDDSHPETKKHRLWTKSLQCLRKLADILYPRGKKEITDSVRGFLTPLALATWYCDDGNTSAWKSGYKNNPQRPRATLHTQSFTKIECEILADEIERLGITRPKINGGPETSYKGYVISLSTDGTHELFTLIAPYTPRCMDYKVPIGYRSEVRWYEKTTLRQELYTAAINRIEPASPRNKQKYDIEVEGNHNYYAGAGLLVSNSNTCVIRHKDQIHLQRKGGLVGKSEHAQFQFFWHWAMRMKWTELMSIPPGHWIYGELMRCVHTVFYNKLPDWFIVFDVYSQKKQKFLTRQQVEEFCQKHKLHCVPLIGEGHYGLKDLFDTIPKESAFGNIVEGIVVKKRTKKAYLRGKIVKPEFLKHLGKHEHWMHQKPRFNEVDR